MTNVIWQGDCLKALPKMHCPHIVFADPPDNRGMRYNGFKDKWPSEEAYTDWLLDVIREAIGCGPKWFWLSVASEYIPVVYDLLNRYVVGHYFLLVRLFMWRYTFGQHNNRDCGRGFRAIFRVCCRPAILYPDAIRIESARQKMGDKRANPDGRVPDDVWEFPRVVGNAKERHSWHPTQHPEALLERIVKFTTKPGDIVYDMFAGTGSMGRVCKRLGRHYYGFEISPFYCEKIVEETGVELRVVE